MSMCVQAGQLGERVHVAYRQIGKKEVAESFKGGPAPQVD